MILQRNNEKFVRRCIVKQFHSWTLIWKKKMKTLIRKDTCTPVFITVLFTGTLEDAEAKDGLVVEGVLSELNHLSPIQGVEASLCVPSVREE